MPVKRWEKVCAALGVLLIAAGLLFGRPAADSRREIVIESGSLRAGAAGCRVPATVLRVHPAQEPIGAAVLLHGLAANRRIMTLLGESLAAAGLTTYLIDLPGHGDNSDPFSFARAEECSAAVVEQLVARGEITLDRTVLVGHSLGGDIAIRLADRFTARATIAISPGPLVPVPGIPAHLHIYDMPKRTPDTLLIFSGGFDVPGFAYGAREMMEQFGGQLTTPKDNVSGRPRKLVIVPATHTSLVFDSTVRSMSSDWAQGALSGHFRVSAENLVHFTQLTGLNGFNHLHKLAMVLGVALLFPGMASHLARGPVVRIATYNEQHETFRFGRAATLWFVAAIGSVLIQAAVVPLRFLGLYTGSYLASMALLIPFLLLPWWRSAGLPGTNGPVQWRLLAAGLVIGGGMAMYLVLAFGWAFSQGLGDLWMNSTRWWRFLVLIPCMIPYALLEELAMGAPSKYWRHEKVPGCEREGCTEHGPAWERWPAATKRLARWLTLRFVLWLPLVAALFLLRSEHILAAVMAPAFLMVSLGQRIGADAIRRRTGSFVAAAIFSAILAAWFIAAVFPLT